MKKRIIITTVVLAGIHFVLAIGSIGIAFGSGVKAFDNPDYQPPRIERIAARLAGVLAQPGRSLWTPWMSRNMPNVVEWGLCLINSVLWGTILALILNVPMVLRGKRTETNGAPPIS